MQYLVTEGKTSYTKKVYKHGDRLVTKVSKAGDNFGYVQDVKTGEEFSTYGYDSLVHIGRVDQSWVVSDVKTEIILK